MPFDPSYPPTNAPIESAPMRDQFNGLNDLISAKTSIAEVNNTVNLAISGTSNNSNAVGQMSLNVDPSYNQAQIQQISDKLDELILALRR